MPKENQETLQKKISIKSAQEFRASVDLISLLNENNTLRALLDEAHGEIRNLRGIISIKEREEKEVLESVKGLKAILSTRLGDQP